jgi:hypothetical protein
VQVAHEGEASVPLRIRRTCPQPAQRAQRCIQALHHGNPVAVEIAHGTVLEQMLQDRTGRGRQAEQIGPSGGRA